MNFLVGYNGSDIAREALSLARTYAEISDAKIFVITSMGGGTNEKPEQIRQAQEGLSFAQQFLLEKGIACETHQLVRGKTPGEDVVTFAEEYNIDQIFVGVEKRSRTQKILMGSTAQYIILKAPCPVVSVNRSSVQRSNL